MASDPKKPDLPITSLQRGDLSESQRRALIDDALGRVEESDFCDVILPHCVVDELGYVISQLIRRRRWRALGQLLQRGDLSDEQRRHIIGEGIEHGGETPFALFILPHCVGSDLGYVISQLVRRRWWRALGKLLQRGDLSDEQRRHITGNAKQQRLIIEHAEDERVITCILPHCAGDELDGVIAKLITQRWWQTLGELLHRGDLSDEQRRHIIEGAIEYNEEVGFYDDILHHCLGDELGNVTAQLVRRRRWRALGELLQRGDLSYEQRRHIIGEGIEHGAKTPFALYILPHCAGHELDDVIAKLIPQRWWRALGELLQRGDLSDEQRRHITDNAEQRRQIIEHAVEENTVTCILPHCVHGELDDVIAQFIRRRRWQALGKLLQLGDLSDEQRRHIIGEGIEDGDETPFALDILPHCVGSELDYVISQVIKQCRWRALGKLLQRGDLSDEQRRHIIGEGIEHGDETHLVLYILPHCVRGELDGVIAQFIRRRRWRALGQLLQRGDLSDEQRRHITGNAEQRRRIIEHAEEERIITCILPHCVGEELDDVIAKLIPQRWKQTLGKLLQQGDLSDEQRRHIIEGAIEYTEEVGFYGDILRHCVGDELGYVTAQLIRRRRWWVLGELLQRGDLSDEQRRHITGEVIEDDDEKPFVLYILPHCAGHELDDVIAKLIPRRWCQALGELLQSGDLSDEQRRHITSNAEQRRLIIENAEDERVITCILPDCVGSDLGYVIAQVIRRRWWRALGKLLQRRDLSDEQRRHIIGEIIEGDETHFVFCIGEVLNQGVETPFVLYILPHCAGAELGYVISELIRQRWWKTLGQLLQLRDLHDEQRRHITGNAEQRRRIVEHAEDERVITCILPHCVGDELDDVIAQFIRRRRWRALGELLQRGDLSDKQRRRIIGEGIEHGDETHFALCFLPHCVGSEVDDVISQLIRRRWWRALGKLLQRGDLSDEQRRRITGNAKQRRRIIEHAEDECVITCILPHYVGGDLGYVIAQFIRRGWWWALGKLFQRGDLSDKRRRHIIREVIEYGDETPFALDILPHCVRGELDYMIALLIRRRWWRALPELLRRGDLRDEQRRAIIDGAIDYGTQERFLCEVLPRCASGELGHAMARYMARWSLAESGESSLEAAPGAQQDTRFPDASDESDDDWRFARDFLTQCGNAPRQDAALTQLANRHLWEAVLGALPPGAGGAQHAGWTGDDPRERAGDVQTAAVRVLIRNSRWGVIGQLRVSHLWETSRRDLFRAAVEQRQWGVVRQWADHTLYDDQRWWALGEAYREKQWGVYLLLADHSLTESELRQAHYRLAKYGDWSTVLHMLERGADVTEVKELLQGAKDRRRGIHQNHSLAENRRRCADLGTLERIIRLSADSFESQVQRGQWRFVLTLLLWRPHGDDIRLALEAAIGQQAWRALMQLVRLGIDAARRDSLFTDMVRRGQWAVCRVLLERGVSVELCLAALPAMMEMDQWLLVARVMEYDVGDDERRRVLERAMARREGSVVWQCISTMHGPLTVEEREELFQRAFRLEIWQAVKPLVEEADPAGIRHRDTALPEAVIRHQWDMVDHCQRHQADINARDAQGVTPLHRAAGSSDWQAVEEVVFRDGDQTSLDSRGCSVLYRAIEAERWDLVKMLIEFQGDLNLENHNMSVTGSVSPLQMLIDGRRGDMIDLALLWSPGLSKGVGSRRETALHAACASGWWSSMFPLVAWRGVDPLAVTEAGESALLYAVRNQRCPQRMVAECIKLGLSTHQPSITDTFSAPNKRKSWIFSSKGIVSPVEYASLWNAPVLLRMLYESGSCSNGELFRLKENLFLEALMVDDYRGMARKKMENACRSLPYLEEVCSTPRSLVSTCRLVISHGLVVRGKFQRDAYYFYTQLPKPMRHYVMFTDLTDPDYGKDCGKDATDVTGDVDCSDLLDVEVSDDDSDSDDDAARFGLA